jgi:hypothetical protein
MCAQREQGLYQARSVSSGDADGDSSSGARPDPQSLVPEAEKGSGVIP